MFTEYWKYSFQTVAPRTPHQNPSFLQKWDSHLIKSSTGHHQANSKAEAAVISLESMMSSFLEHKDDLYKAFLELRNKYWDKMGKALLAWFFYPHLEHSFETWTKISCKDSPIIVSETWCSDKKK